MTRVDEFTSFYRSTSSATLRTVYAMAGDRQVALEATGEAYRRAWRDWSKIRAGDPLPYVRTEAWKATAVSRGTHLLRRRHEEDADTDLLEALHDLGVDERRLIVLLTLGNTDLDQASREVDVSAEEGIELVTTALDALEARLGIGIEQLETRLRGLGAVTEQLELPDADQLRKDSRRGHRRNTVALVAAAVVAVLLGGLVSVEDDTLAAEAELPYREKLGSERPDVVLQARKITSENLLTASQVARLDPDAAWEVTDTDDDPANETPYATCPTQRFADEDPLGVFVRTFSSDAEDEDRVAESIEVSRDVESALAAYRTTLSWYADCAHPRTQLIGSYVAERPFGNFRILRLRSNREPERTFTVGFAHSGRVTSTLVHERNGGEGPDIEEFALTLNASVAKVCADSGGQCSDDLEVTTAEPPRTRTAPAFLGVVDLPPIADVDRVWSATDPLQPDGNPAATQCDSTDFRRKDLQETSSRVFVIPDAPGVPAEFGITETVGRYDSAEGPKALLSAAAERIAGCPDENLSAQISEEARIEGDGFVGRSWRITLEVSDDERITVRTGLVRRGNGLAQVTMTPRGDYDVSQKAWERIVKRAGERLVYLDG